MPGDRAIQPKLPWANKFQRPTPELLVSQCATRQLSQLVEAARRELSEFGGVTETLSWQGLPWRWSFVYTLAIPAGVPAAPPTGAALGPADQPTTGGGPASLVTASPAAVAQVASPGAALRGHPLAYLIPDPQRPQVSVPLSWQMVESLPMRRLKRFVRDGITHSRLVGDVHWPCWDFEGRSQLDEILDLVSRKFKMMGTGKHAVAEGV